ncbi:MAG: PEGA domain-containing protein [bacterium]
MRIALVFFLVCLVAAPSVARARTLRTERVAIWRIDPLGDLSPEIVARLESLLTLEMGRIISDIVPSIKTQQSQRRSRALSRCQGANRCLAALGRRLRAKYIVSGTLASLGTDYVMTLKMVESATSKVVRSVTEPLSGQRDQLIEAVRVAAYRLLKPELLVGSLQVVVNIAGATIYLQGKRIGVSPLREAIPHLGVKKHNLRITHPDHVDFIRKIKVRFQKTTIVRVTLKRPKVVKRQVTGYIPPVLRDKPTPWYGKWWFWTIVGIVAAGAGTAVGLLVPRITYTPRNCDDCACGGCP